MKNVFLWFAFLMLSLPGIAQAPQAFNYQGIARDASGTPLLTTDIALRIAIKKGALPGTQVYKETHNVQTNKMGLFTIEVGHGHSQIGLFDAIEWGAGDHYIEIEMDPEGGTNFTLLGESQLLSVPYALYAANGSGDSKWEDNSSGIHYNAGNVGIGTNNPDQKLSIEGTVDDGDERNYLRLNNRSLSNRSLVAMELTAGQPNSNTTLTHVAETYDVGGDKFTDYGQLSSSGQGLILRAEAANGVIKFLTGGPSNSNTERMRITGNGNVGIGTETPENKLSILEEDPNGDGRVLFSLENKSTSDRSWAAMRLAAGDGGSYTYLNHHARSYDYEGDKFTDFGQLSSTGKGLILRADAQDGIIKFLAGGDPLSPAERMRISNNGYIGIGTEAPTNLVTIDGNVDSGDRRFFIAVNNNSLSNRSFSAIKFTAGAGSSMTTFGHNSETYDIDDNVTADFGGIFSSGAGIHLTAGGEDGMIKFLTGRNDMGWSFERMRLTSIGNLGIGTEDPVSRLQVADGDVYIEDINNGVIMKSPNGNCWRMTINNDGSIKTTVIACPQ